MRKRRNIKQRIEPYTIEHRLLHLLAKGKTMDECSEIMVKEGFKFASVSKLEKLLRKIRIEHNCKSNNELFFTLAKKTLI